MLSTLFKRAASKKGATVVTMARGGVKAQTAAASASATTTATASFSSSSTAGAKKALLCLYPDPVTGYPPKYVRDSIPHIGGYADGTTAPSPEAIDFTPGELLGCVSGELGLRKFLESKGYDVVVTSSKDGENSVMDQHLPEAEIIISQPFYP